MTAAVAAYAFAFAAHIVLVLLGARLGRGVVADLESEPVAAGSEVMCAQLVLDCLSHPLGVRGVESDYRG